MCIYRRAHALAGEYKPGGYYGLSGIGSVSWMQPATFAAGLVMLLLMSLLPSSSEKAERF